jgi:transposase
VPDAPAVGLGAQKTLRAAEQDRADLVAARAAWRTELAEVDPARLVFLDESGIDTRLTRAYARAARGERAPGKVPWGHWKRLTVIGAPSQPLLRLRSAGRTGSMPLASMACDGVVACMSIAAATSTAVFRAFVEQVLAPALRNRPDAIVVMDNLAAHKAQAVRQALTAARIDHRYLPAYSPDLNPIEPCWSKLKTRFRAEEARTLDALDAELGPALATITAQDAQSWFRLCGYGAPT